MAQIDLKNVTILFRDGDSPVNELEITMGEGNLSWSEKRNIEYTRNKGSLTGGTVREGDEEPVELTLDGVIEFLRSAGGDVTPDEFVKQTGGASSFVGTDDDECAPYAIDIVLQNTPSCSGGTLDEQITFEDFRWESVDYDVKAGTFSLKGKCNQTMPTIIRTAL